MRGCAHIDIGNPGIAGDDDVIRIGAGQSQTFIVGILNGDGGGLFDLNATNLSGTLPSQALGGVYSNVVTFLDPSNSITGVFNGNGGGLNNLSAASLTGTVPSGSLGGIYSNAVSFMDPSNSITGIFSGDGNGLTFSNLSTAGNVTLAGSLNLPAPAIIYSGTNALIVDEGSLYIGQNGTVTLNGGDTLHNTGVGDFALNGEAVSGIGGTYNTAFGEQALYHNTTGFENVASGVGALYANTNGSHNTANGYNTLAHNLTGSNNVAIGYSALYSNTIAGGNTADGAYALFGNTSGNDNIALGLLAGYNNTTGSSNIYVGNPGTAPDEGVIRLGVEGTQTTTFIAGIYDVSLPNSGLPVFVDSQGQLGTSQTISPIYLGTIPNTNLIGNGSLTVTAGTGLSGGGSVSLGGSVTLNNTGVTSLGSGGGVTVSASSGAITLGSSPITVSAGTGLTGGGSVGLGGNITLNNAGVTSLSSGGGVTVSASSGGVTLGSNPIAVNAGSGLTGGGSVTLGNSISLAIGTVPPAALSGTYANGITFSNIADTFIGTTFIGNGSGLSNVVALSAISAGSLSTGAALGAGSGNSISSSGATDSFIGGGNGNQVGTSSLDSAIAGGQNNIVQASAGWSHIGGGEGNMTSSGWSTIGGGNGNVVGSGTSGSTIAGGWECTNNGNYATVPGGYQNTAGGAYSFAAGDLAQANNQGAFVWADSTGSPLTSTNNNSVTMRASGGYRLFSSASTGVALAAGSGSWSNLSDRNAKNNLAPIDPQSVLAGVMSLPITQWSYKTEQGVRHLGPMAQDFHGTFNVGENDTSISTVDEEGVALAAIQGLNQKLESQLKEKDARIDALEERLDRLEKLISTPTGQNEKGN